MAGVGDSRVRNLRGLGTILTAGTTLLRVPRASAAARVVATADRSLVSERAVVERLGDVSVGDELGFRTGYRTLVQAFTSESVHREVVN